MEKEELEGRVKDVTQQGVSIELIDKNGKGTGKEYFAHLGDLRKNEDLLYKLRDKEYKDLETIYDDFDKLEKDQKVKFRAWDEKNKPHAFNVEKK